MDSIDPIDAMWGEIMTQRLVLLLVLVVAVPAAAPGYAQQPYVLGPEDVIEVTVYGQADLTRTVTVLPDGTISLPLAGIITVSGLTINELTKRLEGTYALYIKNPQVAA